MKGLPNATTFLSSGFAFRCLKKPNDELVSSFSPHPVAVAQHPLQVGEMAVNAVCGVRDAHLYVVVPSEQQRQVAPEAQVCAAQILVCVMAFARLGIGGSFLEIVTPLLTPFPEHPLERLLVRLGQHIHYLFEFHGSLCLGMLCEVFSNSLLLVELAPLHLFVWEHLWKPFAPVANHCRHLIALTSQLGNSLGIQGVCLILDKVPQQVSVRKFVLKQHHSVLSAPICGIH